MTRGGGAFYSTQHGAMCTECGRAVALCECRKGSNIPSDGVVRVARETKGRKGKGVTLVHGAPVKRAQLAGLCKDLKRRCGSGGTVKDDVIEIQGDHRDTIVSLLEAKGWTVKRAGG